MKKISALLSSLSLVVPALMAIQGCNALNPACGSARPRPIMGAISPTSVTFEQVQKGAVITVYGSQFVSSSVGVVNATSLATVVVNSTQLQITLTTVPIPAAGTATVAVNTPSGNTGDLGCTSGGTSASQILTITP